MSFSFYSWFSYERTIILLAPCSVMHKVKTSYFTVFLWLPCEGHVSSCLIMQYGVQPFKKIKKLKIKKCVHAVRKAVPNISQSLQREVMPVQKIINTHYSMFEQFYHILWWERYIYIFYSRSFFPWCLKASGILYLFLVSIKQFHKGQCNNWFRELYFP